MNRNKIKYVLVFTIILILFSNVVFAADYCPMCHSTDIAQLQGYETDWYFAYVCNLPEHNNDYHYCWVYYRDTYDNWGCNDTLCYYCWGELSNREIHHEEIPTGP